MFLFIGFYRLLREKWPAATIDVTRYENRSSCRQTMVKEYRWG